MKAVKLTNAAHLECHTERLVSMASRSCRTGGVLLRVAGMEGHPEAGLAGAAEDVRFLVPSFS